MGLIRAIQVQLQGDNNETFFGTLTIESTPINGTSLNATDGGVGDDYEPDPVGASTYVIAVVLLYGLSIVFLIGSHVVLKGRENHRDVEKQIDKFLQQAPHIKEKNAKDTYKNLKHSIIPVVALSSARDLVSRRKSFAAFLVGLPNGSRRGSHDHRSSTDDLGSSNADEDGGVRMPTIEEEESADELERSQNSTTSPAQQTDAQNPSPKPSIHKARFFLGDSASDSSSRVSLDTDGRPVGSGQRPHALDSQPMTDAWLSSNQRFASDSPTISSKETEHLLHVTCV